MTQHKQPNPNIEEERELRHRERPERENAEPDTLEGPGGRHDAAHDNDERDKTVRRGER